MTGRPSIGLIGAGAMGGALLRAWLDRNAIDNERSAVFDPGASDVTAALCEKHGVALNPAVTDASVEVLIAAVKPQIASDVLPAFAPIAKDAVVVSVMAGKSIASLARALGDAPKIVRAMPNLPSSVGKGIMGLYAPTTVSEDERAIVEGLMAVTGDAVWVSAEAQIDAVTAISGSGPAYFFLLAEALEEAGAALGLSKEIAERLARATLAGSGAVIDVEERSAAEMRRAVTSPGGTTQAALEVFDGDAKALRKLVKEATAAAARRAGELTE